MQIRKPATWLESSVFKINIDKHRCTIEELPSKKIKKTVLLQQQKNLIFDWFISQHSKNYKMTKLQY